MKYCEQEGLRYPDDAVKCRACGRSLVDALPMSSLPDGVMLLATFACPEDSCRMLVAPPKTKFCAMCGEELKPISYELWMDKFVRPAMDKSITDVLLDRSALFPPIGELGLARADADHRLNELLKQRTGVDLTVMDTWIEETGLALANNAKTEAARQRALRHAQKLNIDLGCASSVVEALALKIHSSDVGAIDSSSEESFSEKNTRPEPEHLRSTSIRFQEVQPKSQPNELDQGQNSAKSFYRDLITGGAVTNDLVFLSAEKSASKAGLKNRGEFLREVTHKQGTFILFKDGNNGWVLPNPFVVYRRNSLATFFPHPTRDEYQNSKQNIEPLFAVPAGNGRWKLSPPRNGAKSEEVAIRGRQEGNRDKRPVLEFPLAAVECQQKLEGFAKVVRHDGFRHMLVDELEGKGEFSVTTETGLAKNSDDLFAVPRITAFQSERTYLNLYAGYYEGDTRERGEVWILKPAIVDKVSGGWKLRQKGVLQVGNKPKGEVLPRPPDRIEKPSLGAGTLEEPRPTDVSNKVFEKTKHWLVGAILIALGVVLLSLLLRSVFRTPNAPIRDGTMVGVSGGTFLMGRSDGEENERPQHLVVIKTFQIDRYEVTRDQYLKFVAATKQKTPSGWPNGRYAVGTADFPAVGIDWYGADAYCKWLGKRLPTEEEWEFAARGTDGRKYPWGNDWKSGYANAENASLGLADVDKFKGASPYGAIGMVGNAWEWTASKLAPYPGGRLPPDELGDGKFDLRVIRGGSWESNRTSATTTYRWGWPASGGADYSNTGFRCVKDVAVEMPTQARSR